MQTTQEKIKMGTDITWLVITGMKQVMMIVELYVLNGNAISQH